MKKIITLVLLIAAITANAQMTKVKSKSALADSIWLPKAGLEINPIIISAQGDTARSIDYVIHPSRDTTASFAVDVRYFNKSGAQITSYSAAITPSFFAKWTALITKLDLYISTHINRINKL